MLKKLSLVLLAIFILWIAANIIRVRILSQRSVALIRSAVPFERKGTNQQKILILGDSLAYGTGTTASEKSVPGLVAAHYPGAMVVNKSANGKRTNDLALEIKQLEGKYDLILIIIGGNDVLRPWINLEQSGKNLETIYSAASAHADKVIALTTGNLRYTTLFLWPINHYLGARSVELRNYAFNAAAPLENVTYIDLVERNKTVPFNHIKEASDRLHLSDDGAYYWYKAIVDSRAL